MKTDSIFYKLFKTLPESFFQLIEVEASEAEAYQFASIELKQTAFRIDGVFIPIDNQSNKPIYFLEVQFQKDLEFYARFFSEIFLYLRVYAVNKPWRGVVIFPRRSIEPTNIESYRILLESEQVTRYYLDELENLETSLGIGLLRLVVERKRGTPELVKRLVNLTRTEVRNPSLQQEVLDLIETIVLYKLPQITRQELAEMFGLKELKRTRYYQEVKEEVREEIKQEVKEEVKQEEAMNLVLRLLQRRLGAINPQLLEQISRLSVTQLENLALALLDFSTESDLIVWLENNS